MGDPHSTNPMQSSGKSNGFSTTFGVLVYYWVYFSLVFLIIKSQEGY